MKDTRVKVPANLWGGRDVNETVQLRDKLY